MPLFVIGSADQMGAQLTKIVSGATGWQISEQTTGIASVLVFGAGTNYALLLIARYREELRRNPDHRAAMRRAVTRAAERARAGEGPTFIEGLTYRLSGHMAGDLETYRTSEEIEMQRQYEPLVALTKRLQAHGVADADLEAIRAEVEKEVEEAVDFAQNSPWPDKAQAYTDVYAL